MIPVFPLQVFRDRKPESDTETTPPPRPMEEILGLPTEKSALTTEPPARSREFQRLTVRIAGFGGQGVLLLGQLLAEAGLREGLQVSWRPSYGPEMRSGSAHCHVCFSKERIGSPLISHPDVLIAMNEISPRKFAGSVARGGLILYNGSNVPADLGSLHSQIICVPACAVADRLDRPKWQTWFCSGRFWRKSVSWCLRRRWPSFKPRRAKPHCWRPTARRRGANLSKRFPLQPYFRERKERLLV